MVNKNNKKQAKIEHEKIDELYMHCCKSGDLETIKNILTCPDGKFKEKSSYPTNYDVGLTQAAAHGHLDIVQYLLYSEDLKHRPQFNFYFADYLILICENEKFHVADYLLEKNIFDPEIAFLQTQHAKEPSVLTNYLIINCNVPLTSLIQNLIADKPLIAEMFAKRELNRELKEKLDIYDDKNKKFKL